MIKKFLLDKLQTSTAWIGFIGIILLIIGWSSALFFLFLALMLVPEEVFVKKFKEWTEFLKNLDK